jgi:radical SAM-linked protein
MPRIRITFAKQGALRYTGHLDLHKLWERAARRAELPLAYSQGFHPQPRMSLAAALPLGFSSRAEVLDMKLEHEISIDGLVEKLNDTLPSGIKVTGVEIAEDSAPALQTQVLSASYEVRLTEPMEAIELTNRAKEIMKQETLPRQRRGKAYDLRPLIEMLSVVTEPNGLPWLRMTLAAREGATGRPEEVLDALGIQFETTRIERTRLIFISESLE